MIAQQGVIRLTANTPENSPLRFTLLYRRGVSGLITAAKMAATRSFDTDARLRGRLRMAEGRLKS